MIPRPGGPGSCRGSTSWRRKRGGRDRGSPRTTATPRGIPSHPRPLHLHRPLPVMGIAGDTTSPLLIQSTLSGAGIAGGGTIPPGRTAIEGTLVPRLLAIPRLRPTVPVPLIPGLLLPLELELQSSVLGENAAVRDTASSPRRMMLPEESTNEEDPLLPLLTVTTLPPHLFARTLLVGDMPDTDPGHPLLLLAGLPFIGGNAHAQQRVAEVLHTTQTIATTRGDISRGLPGPRPLKENTVSP